MARKLDITVKMGCKVDCRFCPQKLALSRYFKDNPKRESVLSFENFKTMVDKTPSDVQIVFSGMCEPFLNEHCIEMIEYAANAGRDVDVYSTLLGMSMEHYQRLKKLKLHIFVLHAADKDMNAKIPVTDEYLKVLDSIAEDHKNGSFHITTISVHGDYHPQIVDIMKKVPDVPVLREIYDRAGNIEDKDGITTYVKEEKKGALACSKCNGLKLDINYILPDGTMLMCPMDWGMENVLGNLLTESYEELSEGKIKQDYRAKMSSEDAKILCRLCHASKPLSVYKKAEAKAKFKQSIKKLLGRA